MVDEISDDDAELADTPVDDTDTETLAAEVEQFLRDHDTDG